MISLNNYKNKYMSIKPISKHMKFKFVSNLTYFKRWFLGEAKLSANYYVQ